MAASLPAFHPLFRPARKRFCRSGARCQPSREGTTSVMRTSPVARLSHGEFEWGRGRVPALDQAGTADTAVPRGVFRRAIAAEISVTMSPTGKTSIKVMPMLKRGFL